jgi:hypothetical protein
MAYRFKHGERPLDDFTIQRAVGAGGFGEVYYAISDGGREVALKYLRDNPHVELRGVSHCMNLKSPHLVSIFDVKRNADGEYFIVMEYITGPSLRDVLIAEPEGLGLQKSAFFVREIAKGLSYLHDRGIVHRDLKPGNIFYDDGYVKIGDYGLSKFIAISRHSAQTASVGTVHYMAPEIGSGNYSRGVDIYALGVILYEMLMGKVPFEGSSMGEVLMKHLTSRPEVDHLPAPFAHVIRKALEKDPGDRYQTVDEMIEDLLAVEDVQRSLAGFSPKSLDGAVALGAGDGARSPMPSPNPPRAYPISPPPGGAPAPPVPGYGPGPPAPLPPKLAKRVDRISRRVEDRVAKLAGRAGYAAPPAPPIPRAAAVRPPHSPAGSSLPPALTSQDRGKRFLIAALLAVMVMVLTGFAGATLMRREEGACAFLILIGTFTGLLLSSRILRWLGSTGEPSWVRRFIRLACCLPLTALGAAPLVDHRWEEAQAIVLTLMALVVVYDWRSEFERGTDGELHLSRAFGAGLFAFVVSSIFGGILDGAMPHTPTFAAVVAAGLLLLVHAAGWWLSTAGAPLAGAMASAAPSGAAMGGASPKAAPVAGAPRVNPQASPGAEAFTPPNEAGCSVVAGFSAQAAARATAFAQAFSPGAWGTPAAGAGTAAADVPLRWAVTRMFFGLLAFLLFSGAIIAALMIVLLDGGDPTERTVAIITSIGCAAGLLFALRKTGPVRRPGFWQDTLRPFLISLAILGIGASTTLLVRHGARGAQLSYVEEGRTKVSIQYERRAMLGKEGRRAAIVALGGSLGVLMLAGALGRCRRTARPFVQPPSAAGCTVTCPPSPPPPPAAPTAPADAGGGPEPPTHETDGGAS